jgi:hypothetical protein
MPPLLPWSRSRCIVPWLMISILHFALARSCRAAYWGVLGEPGFNALYKVSNFIFPATSIILPPR